ncbi:MAG: hypothetical protein J6F30_13160 [Cellulosilyticum sp.]|uniref:Uncharacterized protein n=1 Tax=Cellulosilyticum lentocellum (strain ATCC 49066 / DSM 5427 / NCIMB 11756 / RHM5) TaxID=642492 RepID=F2JPH2_CELLD|nr:hypothetical protein [Cellulosilyticum lentocellum]ADZ82520.1 hypothetical protein Clole_0787 [Cellulosilyticum lentocellum DSM 5427]MBP3888569.1 hypothetical protein [Cellulosilyticum sp.]
MDGDELAKLKKEVADLKKNQEQLLSTTLTIIDITYDTMKLMREQLIVATNLIEFQRSKLPIS